MKVSKKSIFACRALMWGGIGIVAAGAIVYYAFPEYIDLCLILLGGGLVVSVLGGVIMRRLFRCPECKRNVLGNSSSIDLRSTEVPKACPNCGLPVQITD